MLVFGVVGRLGEALGSGAVAVTDEHGALLVLAWRRERSGQSLAPSPRATTRAGISALMVYPFQCCPCFRGTGFCPLTHGPQSSVFQPSRLSVSIPTFPAALFASLSSLYLRSRAL